MRKTFSQKENCLHSEKGNSESVKYFAQSSRTSDPPVTHQISPREGDSVASLLLSRTIAGALEFKDVESNVSEVGEGGEETETARSQGRIPVFRKSAYSRPCVDGFRTGG